MTSQTLPLFAEQKRIRRSKRERIYEMFKKDLGVVVSSRWLHELFGSAFRTRVSEINRDPASEIVIRNQVKVQNGQEMSWYWAEAKKEQANG